YLTSLDIPVKEEVLDLIYKGRTIGPDVALEEITAIIHNANKELFGRIEEFRGLTHSQKVRCLANLHFESMAATEQSLWLSAVAAEAMQGLYIRKCDALTDSFFGVPSSVLELSDNVEERSVLDVRNLRRVDLSGCGNLSHMTVELLGKEAVGLESLRITHM